MLLRQFADIGSSSQLRLRRELYLALYRLNSREATFPLYEVGTSKLDLSTSGLLGVRTYAVLRYHHPLPQVVYVSSVGGIF